MKGSLFGALLVVVAAIGGFVYTVGAGNEPLLGLDLQGGVSVVLQPSEDSEDPSDEALDQALEEKPEGHVMGEYLMEQGLVSDVQLDHALARQSAELVYEVLRWDAGSFQFMQSRELPDIATDAALGLDVEGILMEGFRRVDEWHLIEREINDFDMVFLRNEDAVAHMARGRLTREELTVLELVNGKNTVKELIRASKMGSFEVSKMLYRLLSIKLIRRRVMPVAV